MTFWDDAEIISAYTREQAIADGMLIACDAEGIAREAGFAVPVAVTAAVWSLVEPTDTERESWGQSVEGRLWDVLWLASFACRRGGPGPVKTYKVIFGMQDREGFSNGQHEVTLKIHSGPGDNAEHVITIMRENED